MSVWHTKKVFGLQIFEAQPSARKTKTGFSAQK
jgi:hypothetical protein